MMKQFFAFLLLCIACGFVNADSNSLVGKCDDPAQVFVVWAENDCALGKVGGLVSRYSSRASFTKDDLHNFAAAYCSAVKSEVRACFKTIAERDCTATQLTELMGHADHTSSICNNGIDATVRPDVGTVINNYPVTGNLYSSCEIDFTSAPMFNPFNVSTQDFAEYGRIASSQFDLEAKRVMEIAKESANTDNCNNGKWMFEGLKRVVFDSDKTRPEPYNVNLNIPDLTTLFSDDQL